MKCCVSTDVWTWTNWLTFSPIRIIVWMPEPDCFFPYRTRCNAEFYYVGKIPRIGIGPWFLNGFIHREPWKQLCRRYRRSTECLRVHALFTKVSSWSNTYHVVVCLRAIVYTYLTISLDIWILLYTPCLKKTVHICFCHNCVKFPRILINFGR